MALSWDRLVSKPSRLTGKFRGRGKAFRIHRRCKSLTLLSDSPRLAVAFKDECIKWRHRVTEVPVTAEIRDLRLSRKHPVADEDMAMEGLASNPPLKPPNRVRFPFAYNVSLAQQTPGNARPNCSFSKSNSPVNSLFLPRFHCLSD